MDGHCMGSYPTLRPIHNEIPDPPARPNRNSWATPNINGIVSVVIRIFPRRGGGSRATPAPGAVDLGALLAEARAAAAGDGGDAATEME